MGTPQRRPAEIGRALRAQFLVADGEAGAAVYFLGLFFLLGAGFALGRGSAGSLFLQRFGVQYLPQAFATLAIGIALFSFAYAAIADRIRPDRLLVILLSTLLAALIPLWLLMGWSGLRLAYLAYFVAFNVFCEILILQATLYFGMSFDGSQSKRLLPIALAGLQAGEMSGGLGLTVLSSLLPMQHIAVLWCGLVALAAGLVLVRHTGGRDAPHMSPARKSSRPWRAAAAQIAQGLRFSRSSALLRNLAIATLFMVIAVQMLEYSTLVIYAGTFRTEQELGIVFGLLAFTCGAITLLVQLFFSGKLLRRYGVRAMNVVFPLGLLAVFIALAASFRVPAALAGSITQCTLLPSMRNPSRALLFQALPDHIQGRARALALAVVLPVGILLAAFVSRSVPAESQHWMLPLVGFLAALGYLAFSIATNTGYPAALLDTLGEKLFVARGLMGRLDPVRDHALMQRLAEGVRHADDDVALAYAQAMAQAFPGQAWRYLLDRALAAGPAVRDRMVRLVAGQFPAAQRNVLRDFLETADDHLRSTILGTLFSSRDPAARAWVEPSLNSDNPRLVACGIQGVHDFAMEALLPTARARWRLLLESQEPMQLLAGLDLVRARPEREWVERVIAAADHPQMRVRRAARLALERLAPIAGGALAPWVRTMLAAEDPDDRTTALQCAVDLDASERVNCAQNALADPHPRVSEAAVGLLADHYGASFTEAALDRLADDSLPLRAQRALLAWVLANSASHGGLAGYAMRRSEEALSLASTLRELRRSAAQGPAHRLLAMAVEERTLECADLTLHSLQSGEDSMTMQRVRAAVTSGDTRHFARAVEALEGLRHREIALTLRKTLENFRGDLPLEAPTGTSPRTLTQIVDYLSQCPDSFLRECARYRQRAAREALA